MNEMHDSSEEPSTLHIDSQKLNGMIATLRALRQTLSLHEQGQPSQVNDNPEAQTDPLDEIDHAVHQLKNHLEQSREGNEVVQQLLQSAMEPVPLQDQLDQTLMLLFYLEWLPVQSKGAIYLVDEASKEMVLRAYTAMDEEFLTQPKQVSSGEGVCGRSATTKQFLQIDNQCCIPITSGDQLLGLMYLFLKDTRPLSPEHITFLLSVASVLEVIIIRKAMDAEILNIMEAQKKANEQLDRYNQFIRSTFGRYMSDEVVDSILDTPKGLQLGGEKKRVTVVMTDLRGFTAIGERLPPERVLPMLNMYLEVMTEILLKHNGTIIEFLGDGILALFGAPVTREDDAQRAVACVLEMQKAMPQVNAKNLEHGFPEVMMGAGINTGEVIAGNIGSDKRSKYGVVGKTINLTARIESFTVGGQILISESTLKACSPLLRIDDQLQVQPKGVPEPITIYQVGGIDGPYQIHLPKPKEIVFQELPKALRVYLNIVAGKQSKEENHEGELVAIAQNYAQVSSELQVKPFTNLKIQLFDDKGKSMTTQLYGKVITAGESSGFLKIHMTSIPPTVEEAFRQWIKPKKS